MTVPYPDQHIRKELLILEKGHIQIMPINFIKVTP